MKKLNRIYTIAILSVAATMSCFAQSSSKAMVIQDQGSFAIGGSKIQEKGTFALADALNAQGQTFHGDHAYVFYQIPKKTRKLPMVFLHGAGQSKKTWETTPDGRDGFQNIFLRNKFSVYLLDQPRRGEAGRSTVPMAIKPVADEQFWFTQFRIGNYPAYFPNVQFSQDALALEQFFRQMTPNTGDFDAKLIAGAVSDLFNTIGSGILVTHSQGGGPGWLAAMNNDAVRAVVAYEPFSGFVFPEGELPEAINSTGLFGAVRGAEISRTAFMQLTKIPIVIYYGDNIAESPTTVWNMDHWRSGLEMATKWADTVNKYGGDVTIVHLPKIGIHGNTHFPFADLNNVEVADELYRWLKLKDLHK